MLNALKQVNLLLLIAVVVVQRKKLVFIFMAQNILRRLKI